LDDGNAYDSAGEATATAKLPWNRREIKAVRLVRWRIDTQGLFDADRKESTDMGTRDSLTSQLAFLAEIDALKSVVRQSLISDRSRRENSAEHSWHLAMFALILAEDHRLDVAKVISMLLIHDIVEIDAGDAPIHGVHDRAALEIAETKAAERLFGLLPTDQAMQLLSLRREFEGAKTPEAQFAKALDRLQPLLLNTLTAGGTWTENGVSEQQVYERYGPAIEAGSPRLWEAARALVRQYFANFRP
jgi:putative hydrolases of HD superfamily